MNATKLLLLFLFAFRLAHAGQDLVWGLGGQSTAQPGLVVTEEQTPFAALYNPSLLATHKYPYWGFGIINVKSDWQPLQGVLLDSPQYRTIDGSTRVGEKQLTEVDTSLWSAGVVLPLSLPFSERRFGLGLTVFSPINRLRRFVSSTPYDFYTLRYGTADTQFKAILGAGGEVVPRRLYLGLGLAFYFTGAGAADAAVVSPNPTARLSWDIGMNTSVLGGGYLTLGSTKIGFTGRQAISPVFNQRLTAEVEFGGTSIAQQPILLSTSLYFEPALWELEAKQEWGDWSLAAGISWQRWSEYRPTYLTMKTRMLDGSMKQAALPKIQLRDSWNPRVGLSKKWGNSWRAMLGYQFRQTPVVDSSDLGNLIDTNTHVTGIGVSWQPRPTSWLPWQLRFSLVAQRHWMVERTISKENAAYIGGSGYPVSGSAYAYGLSIDTQL